MAELRLLGDAPDRVSPSGVLMTKEFEDFSPDIYLDTRKKRTIGYGFNIDDETISELFPEDVVSGKRPTTKEEADIAFDSIYSRAKKDAVSYLGEETFDKLDQERQDIVTDMAYNLGKTRLSTFKKLKKALQTQDYDKAAEEMKNSKWYKQVGDRAKVLIRKMEETKDRLDLSRLNPFRIDEAEAAEMPALRLLGDRPVRKLLEEGMNEEIPKEDRMKIALLELGDIRIEPFLKLATKEEFERREADIKAKVRQIPEGVKGLGTVLKVLSRPKFDLKTGDLVPPTSEEKQSMLQGLQFVGNVVNELFWRPLTGWFQSMLKETARRQFKREDYISGKAGFQSLPRAMARGLLGIEDVEGKEILEAGGLPKTEELIIKHPVLATIKELWGATLDVLPLPILRPIGTVNKLLKEGKYAAADKLAIETSETIAKARYEQMGNPLGKTWEELPAQTRNVAIKMIGEVPMKQLGNKSIADIFYERPFRALKEVARRQLVGKAGALRIGDLAKYGEQTGVITGFKGNNALLNIAGKEISVALAKLTPAPPVEPPEVAKPADFETYENKQKGVKQFLSDYYKQPGIYDTIDDAVEINLGEGGTYGIILTPVEQARVKEFLRRVTTSEDLYTLKYMSKEQLSKYRSQVEAIADVGSKVIFKPPTALALPAPPKPLVEPIPKELEPLAEEAKKFTTAEEFVESKQIEAFRYGKERDDVIFSSKMKDYAEEYAEVKKGKPEDVKKIGIIASNPLIIEASPKEFADPAFENKYIQQAKENGNDVVIFRQKESGDEFYAQIKQNIKTKSQLTDIWKQAQAKPAIPKAPTEALAGKPEEETFAELSEFFERAGRAEADVAPRLSEEDIAKSQAEFKVVQGESQSALFDAVKKLGKIRPYAKGFLKEELAVVPAHLRTLEATAMTADEMAEALSAYGFKFTGDMDLITAIGDEVAMAAKVKIEYQEAKQYLKDLSKRIRVRTKETEKLIKSIGRLLSKGTLTGPAVKRQIRLVTGQTKIVEMVREDIALREVLKKEQQISRMAAVEARKAATVKFRRHAKEVKTQAKERKDIREETNKLLERIRKVNTSKMSPISAEAIEEIQGILDFTKPSRKTLSRLNETRKYLERNPDAELPDYVYEDLERLEKLDRSEITLDELRSLADAVDHHVALERTTDQIRVGREMKRADEAVTDSVMEMKPVQDIKEAMITSQKGKLAKGKHIGQLIKDTFGIRHDHYDLVIESLAGANSTMDKVLYQGPKEGTKKELAHRQKVFKQFQKDLEAAGFAKFNIKDIGAWMNERIPIRGLNLTRAERMALYRHTLNENNWLHIVEGGFAFKQGKDPYKVFEVTEEDLEAIIKSLDMAEKTFAGSPVDKLYERQYDALNEVFRAKNGYNLPKEEFYYKIEVMRTALPKELEAESILEELKHKWVRVGLRKGMLKARRKSNLPIYLNSIAYDINSSVLNAAAYVGLEIPLSNASKLLYNKAFRAELTRRYGDITWKEIEKGLRDIAGDFQSYSSTEELLLFLKNNLSTAILGLNPFVAAKQVLSFPLYSIYVKPEYLIQGFVDHITHPLETMERHKLYSPGYAERVEGGYSRDVADVFKTGAEKRLYAGRKSVREVLMGGVKLLDLNAVNPGMQGAVLQVLDELKAGKLSSEPQKALDIKESDIPGLSPEEKMALAYKFADWTTERTQPMFSPEHRSSLSRGSTIEKLATQFSSFTNQALNLIRRTWREARRTKDPKMYAKLAKVLFLLLGVNTAGVMVIDNIRSRMWRSKYRKTFGEALLDSVASYFYFIREVERSVVSKVKKGTFMGYDINIPVLGAGNTIGDAVANGFGMLTADTKKERRKHADKFIDSALASSLMLIGIPYYTPKKLIQAVIKPKKKVKKRKLRTLGGGRTLRLLK